MPGSSPTSPTSASRLVQRRPAATSRPTSATSSPMSPRSTRCPCSSHQFHWIELARLRHEPHPSPIRRRRPLFNIYADRSEGFATAMEEVAMQAGLYDDEPARPGAGVDHAGQPRRARARLAPRPGQRDRPSTRPATSTRPGPRAAGPTPSSQPGRLRAAAVPAPARLRPELHHRQGAVRRLLARASHRAELENGRSRADTFAAIWASGIVPPAIIEDEFLQPAK